MPIQRSNSQSLSARKCNLKLFIVLTYRYLFPEGVATVPAKELRQILQMLQRLSLLHPEQFLHDRMGLWAILVDRGK
jgi:hypothetical protein